MVQTVFELVLTLCAVYMITCFTVSNIAESGGHFWKKGVPVLKKGYESQRFLVSLRNGIVTISAYDRQNGFNVPDVVAWRKLPLSYRGFGRRYLFWRKKGEEDRRRQDKL